MLNLFSYSLYYPFKSFQMGYQPGKGLGKDLQGIHAPIEASVRKGRGAIGIVLFLCKKYKSRSIITWFFIFPRGVWARKENQSIEG